MSELNEMRLMNLEIGGFRSLKNVNWTPGTLNIVIGPNGSGKSNLLRFLELIAVSAQGKLGKYIQSLGGMEPIVWDGRAPGISFTLKTQPLGQNNGPEQYELELLRLGTKSSYRISHELLANYAKVRSLEKTQPFKFLERNERSAVVFDDAEHALVAPPETVPEDETLLSIATGPFVNNRNVPLFQKQLTSIAVYHDLHVNRDAVIRQPAVAREERRVDPDGQNLIPVLHTLYTGDRDFKKNIDSAMRAAFGNDFEELVFPPAADQRIQLRVRWKTLKREQSAADLSDGTLRFLFLLTVLASPSPAPVIAIDEPETGLHPSMLPIVSEYAVDASLRAQVILTTHSPQLLDAFTDTEPTTTVAKWGEGATTLEILDNERLAYWLKEYSLGVLFKSGELEEMA
ncbi:MAG TPA: AAA family ATPase [Pyrinomonadaceae bacterium]|nr:AAA family ATPase [Pyrinomonadaceae bacterium]